MRLTGDQKHRNHLFPKPEEKENTAQKASLTAFGKAYKMDFSSQSRSVETLREYDSLSLEESVFNLIEEAKWECVQFEIKRPQDEGCSRFADRLKDVDYTDSFTSKDFRFFQAARQLFDEKGKYALHYTKEKKCAILLDNRNRSEDTCYRDALLNRQGDLDYSKKL